METINSKKIALTLLACTSIFLGSFFSAHAVSTFIVQQGGTGQNSFTAGNLIYGSGTNPLQSIATTTATCTGTVSCAVHTIIGSSPVTITGSNDSGTVSTSTHEVANQLPLWTSTSGTPALLGQITNTTNGFVLSLVSGVPSWVATTTYSSGLLYTSGNVTNTGVTSIVAGTNVTISGATGAVTINSSGGGSVAGSGTQIQLNNYGTFGASADFAYATSTGLLTVGGSALSSNIGSLRLANGSGPPLRYDVISTVGDGPSGNEMFLLPDANGTFALGTGAANKVAYWSNANVLTDSSLFSFNGTNLGIGTSSPYSLLSIGGNVVIGASTAGGTLGDLFIPKYGTSAGAFAAFDPTGKLISTTTPSGGSGLTAITGPTGLSFSGTPTSVGTLASGFSIKELPSWTVCSSGCDFTTIQGALNAASSTNGTNGGGTIYLTDAVYNQAGTGLLIKSPNTIITSNASTTINFTGATTLFKSAAPAYQFSNVTISHLTMIGDGTAGSVAVDMSNMSHSYYENNVISTVGTMFKVDDTQNITFYNKIDSNNGSTISQFGINASSTNPWNRNSVTNNFIGCSTASCVGLQMTNANGNDVENNAIEPASANSTVDIKIFDNAIATCNGVFNNVFKGNYLEGGKTTGGTQGVQLNTNLCSNGGIQRNSFQDNVDENHNLDWAFPTATSTLIAANTFNNDMDSNFGNPLTSFQGPFGIGTSTELASIGTTPFTLFGINPIAGDPLNDFTIGSSSATLFDITNAGGVAVGTATPETSTWFSVGSSTYTALFVNQNSGKVGIGCENTTAVRWAFGCGSDLNINSNINLLVTDPADARLGTAVANQGVFMKSVTGTGGGLYAYDYSLGAARPLIFQEFGNVVGIGTTTPTAELTTEAASTTAGTVQTAYVGVVAMITGLENTTLKIFFEIDQWGHQITSGDTTSVTGGTSTVSGNDDNGKISVVGTALTSVTLTFAHAWPSAPDCTESDNSTALTADITSISTTQVVFGFSVGVSSGTVWYQCTGHQ